MPAYVYPPLGGSPPPKKSSGGPKPKAAPDLSAFNGTWAPRIQQMRAAGYHPQMINAAINYDWKQVQAGKKALTDQQAYAAVHAVQTKRDIFKTIHPDSGGGGLFDSVINTVTSLPSNSLHDVEGIAQSLDPRNIAKGLYHAGVGLAATDARVVGEGLGLYGHSNGQKTGVTNFLDEVFSHIPDYNHERKLRDQMYAQINHKVKSGDWGGGMSEAFQLPGLQLIPGTYTASGLSRGDFGQITKHPVMTALDLLPAETKIAKGLSAGTAAATYSAREAFQQGKFLRGVTRAVGGTKKITPESSARAVEAALRDDLTKIPRTSEALTKAAEHFGVSHLQRDIYEAFNVGGRKLQKAGSAAREAQMETFARDLSEADQTKLYDAVTSGDPKLLHALSPELQGRAAQLQDAVATQAVNELLPRGFVGMEFNGKTYFYHPSSLVGKARTTLTRARKAYDKVEMQVRAGDHSQPTAIKLAKSAKKVTKAEKELAKRFHDNPPREFYPAAYAKAQQRAETALKEMRFTAGRIDQETYEHALESLRSDSPQSLWVDNLITKQEWNKFVKDAGKDWQRMAARQGFDPTYVPNAAEGQIETMFSTRPLIDTGKFTPGQFKNAKLTQFKPEVSHVALQMSKSDLDQLHGAVQQEALNFITQTHSMTYAQIRELEKARTGGSDVELSRILKDKYYAWSAKSGLKTGTLSKFPNANDLYVPKAAYDALDSYIKQYGTKGGIKGNILGTYDKGTKFFRVAVTATPRHLVHVAATGVARALGEQGLSWIPQVHAAWGLAHEGIPELGSNISAGALTADEGRDFLEGRIHASVIMDHLSKIPGVDRARAGFNWYRDLEEHIGQTLKYSSMLAAEKKGLKSGLSMEDARVQAIAEANRIHMDLDRMSPIERNVVRRVFPFYGFTSEILRYMLQYPADHPVAAAIISRMALMEQQDYGTGLPQMFNSYFQSIGPMKPDGTQSYISTRALNPFRSLGNGQSPFTLAGLTSGLNPYLQSGLRILGVDPLNASTNPYQQQQVDPFTGGAVSVHTGFAGSTLNTFFPQSSLITDYIAQVPGLNKLKLTDPNAYRTSVFTALGIPSEMVVPFNKNLYDERIKLQNRYLSQAQKQLSTLIKSGDYDAIKQYDYLPYKTQILTPQQLIDQLKAGQ